MTACNTGNHKRMTTTRIPGNAYGIHVIACVHVRGEHRLVLASEKASNLSGQTTKDHALGVDDVGEEAPPVVEILLGLPIPGDGRGLTGRDPR